MLGTSDANRVRNALPLSYETGVSEAASGHRKAGPFLDSRKYLPTATCSGIHAAFEEKTLAHYCEEQHAELKEIRDLGPVKLGASYHHDAGIDTAGNQGDKFVHRDVRPAVVKAAGA